MFYGVTDCPLGATMKRHMLRNIRDVATIYGTWLKASKFAPIFSAYQKQLAMTKAELMMECATYRVTFCCSECKSYDQEGGTL